MKSVKYIFIILINLFCLNSCRGQALQENVDQEIIGTWIAEDDPKVKLVFSSNGELKDYYNNELTDTYDYSISHECGSESDTNAWFLKTSNKAVLEIRCYEIYGVNDNNDKVLSIRDMRTGKTFIYNKQ